MRQPDPTTTISASPLVQYQYVTSIWHKNTLFRRDPLAKEFFSTYIYPTTALFDLLTSSSPTSPLLLHLGTLSPSPTPELFLTLPQCKIIKSKLAESLGPTRTGQTWSSKTHTNVDKIEDLQLLPFASAEDFSNKVKELKRAQGNVVVKGYRKDLELLREVYGSCESGVGVGAAGEGALFVALDVETWEMNHDLLTEFGWSTLVLPGGKRESNHVVVAENASRRNGRYCPDARDHFDFGTTSTIPQRTLLSTLSALLTSPSPSSPSLPLFLICHDPKSDLAALDLLGIPTSSFHRDTQILRRLLKSDLNSLQNESGNGDRTGTGKREVIIIDTQILYCALSGEKQKVGLQRVCKELGVETRRLHNAGNDAHYTLEAFRKLMDPERVPVELT